MSESKKKSYSIKTILLLVVIIILAGIVIFQQVQMSYLQPLAQKNKTELLWIQLATTLYTSELGALSISNHSAPPLVVVPYDTGLYTTCASVHRGCNGYDYSFDIINVCQNSTYYGTCNFMGYLIYWYDITKNVLFITGLNNISIPQGQTVTTNGNWGNGSYSYAPAFDDLMFLEVSTSGGWATAVLSINS